MFALHPVAYVYTLTTDKELIWADEVRVFDTLLH